jgi:hypothetical protein
MMKATGSEISPARKQCHHLAAVGISHLALAFTNTVLAAGIQM